MILIIFTKRQEECKVFFCIEELLHTIELEVYLFEEIYDEKFYEEISKKERKIIIFDYMSYLEYTEKMLKRIKMYIPDAIIVIMNAPEDIHLAVKILNLGASYYFTKDLNYETLCSLLNEILGNDEKRNLKQDAILDLFIGESPAIRKIKEFLPTIAETHCNVLLLGETGTGKEHLARIIHQLSSRKGGPFVVLDCTLLQETIFESEVFGYEKGAFTGAFTPKKGLVELADGGTLFIDEVGELPLSLQKKFLRFIQEKTFLRVGGTKFLKSDVRIISATNKKLEEEVKKGNFRSDLYFRLNTIVIEIPPLKERKEDIPLLIEHFLQLKSKELGKMFKGFSKGFLQKLLDYSWPGNVRELINVIERALVLSPDGYLSEDLLNFLNVKVASRNIDNLQLDSELNLSQDLKLKEVEREIIIKALRINNFNQTKTAAYLGISRKQLINKMKKYGLFKEKNIVGCESRE